MSSIIMPRGIIKPPGLVLDLPMQGDAKDISGLGNDGTVNGGVTVVQGKYGGCYSFDGVSGSYISFGDIFDYTDNFTIMAWIKTASVNGIIASRDDVGANRQYLFQITGAGLLAFYDGTTNFSGSGALTDDEWRGVGVVIKGANSQLYVAGVPNGSVFNPSGLANETVDFAIGADNNGDTNRLNGEMDQFKIFNRALTEAQFQYEMYREAPLKPVMNGGVLWPN